MPDDSWCTTNVKEAVLAWLKASLPDCSTSHLKYAHLQDGNILAQLLQLIQSFGTGHVPGRRSIPARPYARFAKIDAFIQGAVKIGAIYSLNIGAILNHCDEQELCKAAVLLLFLGSLSTDSPILHAGVKLADTHQIAIQAILKVIQNKPEPVMCLDSSPSPVSSAAQTPPIASSGPSEPLSSQRISRLRSATESPLMVQLMSSPFESTDKQAVFTQMRKLQIENLNLQDEKNMAIEDGRQEAERLQAEIKGLKLMMTELRNQANEDMDVKETQLNDLQQTNASLHKKLQNQQELVSRVQLFDGIVDSNNQLVEQLEDEKKALRSSLDEVTDQLTNSRQTLTELQLQLKTEAEKHAESQCLLQTREVEVAELKQLLNSQGSHLDASGLSGGEVLGDVLLMEAAKVETALRDEIQEHIKTIDNLKREQIEKLTHSQNEVKSLSTNLLLKTQENMSMHANLQELKQANNSLIEKCDKLQQEARHSKEEFQQKYESLFEVKASFEQRTVDLGKQLSIQKEEYDQEISGLEAKCDEQLCSLSEASEQTRALEGKLEALNINLAGVTKSKLDMEQDLNSIIHEKGVCIKTCEDENAKLSTKLQDVEAARADLMDKLEKSQEQVDSLSGELSFQKQAIGDVSQRLKESNESNQQLLAKCEHLEKENTQSREEAQRKYDALWTLKASLEEQLAAEVQEIASLKANSEVMIAKLQATIDKQAELLTEQATQIHTFEGESFTLQTQYDKLQRETKHFREEFQQKYDSLFEVKASFEQRTVDLEQQISALKGEYDQKVSSLQVKFDEQLCSLSGASEHTRALEGKLEALDVHLASVTKSKLDIEQNLNDIIHEKSVCIKTCEDENAKLSTKLQDVETARTDLMEKLAKSQEHVGSLSNELSFLKEAISDVSQRLKESNESNQQLLAKCEHLEKENTQSREEAQRKYDALWTVKASLEEQLAAEAQEIASLKGNSEVMIAKLQATIDEQAELLTEHLTQSQTLEKESSMLQTQYDKLQEETKHFREKFQQKFDSLFEVKASLEQRTVDLERQISVIKEEYDQKVSSLQVKSDEQLCSLSEASEQTQVLEGKLEALDIHLASVTKSKLDIEQNLNDIIHEKSVCIKTCEDENAKLSTKLQDVEAARTDLMDKLARSQEHVDSLSDELSFQKQAIGDVSQRLKESNDANQQLLEKCEHLEDDNIKSREEAQRKYDALWTLKVSLEEQLTAEDQEIASLKGNSEVMIAELQTTIDKKAELLTEQSTQIHTFERESFTLKTQYDKLQQETKHFQEEFQQKYDSLFEVKASLEQRTVDLERQISVQREEYDQKVSSLQVKCDELLCSLSEASEQTQVLEGKLEALNVLLASVTKSKLNIEQDLNNITHEKSVCIKTCENENAKLSISLQDVEAARTDLIGKLARSQEHVDSLSDELSFQKQAICDVSQRLKESNDANQQLLEKCEHLEEDNVKSREEAQRKYDALWTLKASLEEQLAAEAQEIASLKGNTEVMVAKLQATIDEQAELLTEHLTQSQTLEKESSMLQTQLKDLVESKRTIEEKLCILTEKKDKCEKMYGEDISKLSLKVDKMEKSDAEVVDKLAQSQKQVNSLSEELACQNLKNENLHKSLVEAQVSNQQLAKRCDDLEKEHSESVLQLQQKNSGLHELQVSLEKQISSMKDEYGVRLSDLQVKCDDASNCLAEKFEQIQALENSLQISQDANCQLTETCRKLDGDCLKSKSDYESLLKLKEALEKRIIELEQQVSLTAEKLHERVTELQVQREVASQDLTAQSEELQLLRAEKDGLKVKFEAISETKCSVEQERDEYQRLHREGTSQLSLKLEEAENANKFLKNSLTVLENRVTSLSAELSFQNQRNIDISKEYDDTKNVLNRYSIGYKEKKQIINELKHELKVAQAQGAKYKADLESAVKKYEIMKAQVDAVVQVEQKMRPSIPSTMTHSVSALNMDDLEATIIEEQPDNDQLRKSRRLSMLETTGRKSLVHKTYGDDEADVLIDTALEPSGAGSTFAESFGILGKSVQRVEDPNERISEFQKRNSKFLPHLRSAYPIESQVYTPSKPRFDDIREGRMASKPAPVTGRDTLLPAQAKLGSVQQFLSKIRNGCAPPTVPGKRSGCVAQPSTSASTPKRLLTDVTDDRVNKTPTASEPVVKAAEAFVIENTPRESRRKGFKAKLKNLAGIRK